MSSGAIIAIALGVIVLLGAVLFAVSSRKTDSRRGEGALSRETQKRDRPADLGGPAAPPVTGREVELAAAEERSQALAPVAVAAPIEPYVPPDEEQLGFTRRQFLNRAQITLMIVALSGFGAAVLAFLYPKLGAGFGSRITVGKTEDVLQAINSGKGFMYVPEGRAWVTQYPAASLPKAQAVYSGPVYEGMKAGFNALYQKCPHLGCRVPDCTSSQWFECPCHGSQYNRVGEKKGGPAPRGMDRFALSVSNDVVTIDTGQVFQGPPIGTNTTGQEAEGPHCIGSTGGHG